MAEGILHCTVHFGECEVSTSGEAVSVLTDTRWQTLQSCAVQWVQFDGTERRLAEQLLALKERPAQAAAHMKCYKR